MPTLKPSFHSLRARKYHWNLKLKNTWEWLPSSNEEIPRGENSIIFRWTMLKLRCFLWVFFAEVEMEDLERSFFEMEGMHKLVWWVAFGGIIFKSFWSHLRLLRNFWLHRFPYGLWRFFPPAFDATKQKKPPRQKDWSCCSTGECISRKRMCLGTLDCSRSSREWMYTYIWLYVYIYI